MERKIEKDRYIKIERDKEIVKEREKERKKERENKEIDWEKEREKIIRTDK